MENTVVNINSDIYQGTDIQKAKISVFDRGFLFGDSIYEVTYTHNRSVIYLDEHLDRLYNSASLIGMNLSYSREEIIKEILRTLKVANLDEAYIRFVITRGEDFISLSYSEDIKNNFIIIVKPKPEYPEELYKNGVSLSLVSIIRNDKMATNPNAKSGNYLNNVLAIAEAKKNGFDDALMLNKEGFLTEGTTFNIWMIKNGVVRTPDLACGLLAGITRAKVISLCQVHQIPVEESYITKEDLMSSDEVFITSSTRGIMPVKTIDNSVFQTDNQDESLTCKLIKLYDNDIDIMASNKRYTY